MNNPYKIYATQDWVEEKLEVTKADWNQNDETALDYVKNRPFYAEQVEKTVEATDATMLDEFPVFDVGDTVTVNVDGVEHSLVAFDDDGYIVIGDAYTDIESGEGQNGWQIANIANSCMYFGEDHVISYQGEVVHSLDKKYLPDDAFFKIVHKHTGEISSAKGANIRIISGVLGMNPADNTLVSYPAMHMPIAIDEEADGMLVAVPTEALRHNIKGISINTLLSGLSTDIEIGETKTLSTMLDTNGIIKELWAASPHDVGQINLYLNNADWGYPSVRSTMIDNMLVLTGIIVRPQTGAVYRYTFKEVGEDSDGHSYGTEEITRISHDELYATKDELNNATNSLKNELLNGAGEAYDTLKELGELIDENTDALDALETVANGKADAVHNHDDLYYTEAEVDTKLEAQAETLINHDVNIFYSSWASGAENPDGYIEFPKSHLFPTSPSPQEDDLIIARKANNTGSELLKIVNYDESYVYCEGLAILSFNDITSDEVNAAIATHNTATNAHANIIGTKMNIYNPVGTGSFSMNRMEGMEIGDYSFAEGYWTTASGESSHAEGDGTTASGMYSHAEGSSTIASEFASHAEGHSTMAEGINCHAEGYLTTASGESAHAEGYETTASGSFSHVEGFCTIASGSSQHVQGKYNIADSNNVYAHIVGNGQNGTRSNAHSLDWSGNAWFSGDVYVGSTSGKNKDDGSKKLATEAYVAEQIASASPTPTTENWTFTLADGSTVTKAVYIG